MNFIKQFEQKELHDTLKSIAWLSGRWVTEAGIGSFPNITEFQYHEEVEFICVGQPMFNYMSTSINPHTRAPMHQERGFLRIKPGSNDVAFIISHNFGLASIEEGTIDQDTKTIYMKSVNMNRISFIKPPFVKSFTREIKLIDADTLQIKMYMETDTTPLSEHLKAIYKKQDS